METLSDSIALKEGKETFVSLGHEMAHARDAYKFKDEFNSMSRKVKEQRAMLTENFIRREHGLRQRTFYGLKDGGRYVDYDSYPALVLPPFPVSVSPRNYSYSDPLNIFN